MKLFQKKYLEAKEIKEKIEEENQELKKSMINEYKAGKFVELEIDLMKADIEIRSSIIEEIYKEGKLDFLQKYLTTITPKLRNQILVEEYKKGNVEFVYRNFENIDNGDLKETILSKELKEKNYKFLYENYEYIYSKELREKIIKYAYKEENVDFLNKHLNDMPKALKLEAAIRFKDLKLSKVELAELLRR